MRVSLFTLELGNGSLSRLAVLIVLALSLASIQVSRYFIRTWLVGRVECYELSEILLLQAGTSARRLGRGFDRLICALNGLSEPHGAVYPSAPSTRTRPVLAVSSPVRRHRLSATAAGARGVAGDARGEAAWGRGGVGRP